MASKKKPPKPLSHKLLGSTPAMKSMHRQRARDKAAAKRAAQEHKEMLRRVRRSGWGAL